MRELIKVIMGNMKRIINIIATVLLFHSVILQAGAVRGYVRTYSGNAPISGALVVIEPQRETRFSAQTMTDSDGFFEFRNVPKGIYKIAGMKECFYSNSLFDFYIADAAVYEVRIRLLENPDNDDLSYCFMIGGIEVEAQSRSLVPEEIVTTRRIESGEIDHLQASNLGDVLTLVPGVEKSGQLGLAKQQNVGLRRIKRSDTGLHGFDSFGTSIIIDGNELSGDMKASGYVSGSAEQSGIDLRVIPADNIASVEVITGIPSVEYGNFTDGIVKVETKRGQINRRFKAKFNPDTKGFSYNGGYEFKESIFDYHINYSYSERNLRKIGDEYQRIYGTANLSRSFFDKKLDARIGATYTHIFDDEEPNDEYRIQNTNRGFRAGGKMDMKYRPNKNTTYELLIGVDANKEDVIKQKMVVDQVFVPFGTDLSSIDTSYCSVVPIIDTVYISGTDTIDYIDSTIMVYPYNATATQRGMEWDYSLKLRRKSNVTIGKTKNNLLFGLEFDYEKNSGEGVVLDSIFNYYGYTSTRRSYSFDEYPSNVKVSLYAEDQISFKFLKRQTDILLGIRYDLFNPTGLNIGFDDGFSIFSAKQGEFFSPRINIRYRLTDDLTLRAGTGQSVKAISLTQIYRVPKHVAYYDTVSQKTTEKIFYQVNEELKAYAAQKTEASLDWKVSDMLGVSLTGYYTRTFNRPSSVTYPEGYEINPDTINIQFSYAIYENAGWEDNYGAEFTLRTQRIKDLRFAFNATYRYSESGSDRLIYAPNYLSGSSNWELWYPPAVSRQSKLVLDGQVSYINQRFGVWVTMDIQYTPFYRKQNIYSTNYKEELNDYGEPYLYYQGMSYWYDAELFNYTGQWLINLRISKSLTPNAELSLYINNFFDNRARYISPFTSSELELNSPIYYGLEMSVQL